MYKRQIEGLLAAIQRIEREIKELVTQDTRLDEDVKLLCSIPGIGFSSAVVIVAEMGNISLFRKPKQLATYFGLDPGERQSGTFKGRKNKLSKRGSLQVRAALHMAAMDGDVVYTDVEADSSHAQAIRWVSAEGLMNGNGNAVFGPGDTLKLGTYDGLFCGVMPAVPC